MSHKNSAVKKVLVTTGDQAIAVKDTTMDALAVGQIGIFDEKTKLALDATSAPVEAYVLGVGVSKTGGAVQDSISFSAGQYIQNSGVSALSYRPHTAPQDLIVDVRGFLDAECDADYSLKVELRDQEIYRLQGYNQYTETYSVRTPCCVGTQTEVDGNTLTLLFIKAIIANQTGAYTASPVARQAITIITHGTSVDYASGDVVSEADIDAIIAFNAGASAGNEVYTNIRFYFSALGMTKFCNVNLKYFHPRQILGIITPQEDFTCIGAEINTIQELAFEEGSGYDVKQKEYHSEDGSGPYVTGINGVAFERTFYAVEAVKYDQFSLESDFKTRSGWGEYANVIATTIAVPATDTTTLAGLAAAFDVLIAAPKGFDTLASDVAAADVDPAVVEATEDKGADDDGLT